MTLEEIALEVAAAIESRDDLTEGEKVALWIEACERLGIENKPGEEIRNDEGLADFFSTAIRK